MADERNCGHDRCNCSLDGEAQYCSESCQEANSNDATDEPCACGCDGCVRQQAGSNTEILESASLPSGTNVFRIGDFF